MGAQVWKAHSKVDCSHTPTWRESMAMCRISTTQQVLMRTMLKSEQCKRKTKLRRMSLKRHSRHHICKQPSMPSIKSKQTWPWQKAITTHLITSPVLWVTLYHSLQVHQPTIPRWLSRLLYHLLVSTDCRRCAMTAQPAVHWVRCQSAN